MTYVTTGRFIFPYLNPEYSALDFGEVNGMSVCCILNLFIPGTCASGFGVCCHGKGSRPKKLTSLGGGEPCPIRNIS